MIEAILKRKKIRLPSPSYLQGNAFFITIATYEKYPWFRLYPQLADAAQGMLCTIAEERGAKLYAWCIMPDHIHILLEDNNIVEFARLFKGRMTPKTRVFERNRKLWHRSFYDHGLRTEEDLFDAAVYIWENPVRASLIEDPGRYIRFGSNVWGNWWEFCKRC
jgi:putative transposase